MLRYDAGIEREMARVDALWENQHFEEGHRILEDILLREPGYGKAHAYLGWYVYTQAGDYEVAAEHYRLALRFNPRFAGIYPNYAHVLIGLSRCNDAVNIVRAGLEIGGTDKAQRLATAGRAYEQSRRLSDARLAYREAYYLAEEHGMMTAMKAAASRVRRKKMSRVVGLY